MSDDYSLSVITIAFNDLEGLKRTRESVERLECSWQHVIIDGASVDGSADWLQGLDRENTLTVSEPDGGRYDAMNRGIELAHGDVVIFMHSGDRFTRPDVASRAMNILLQEEAEWGYGLSAIVNSDDRLIGMAGSIPFSLRRYALGGRVIPHQAAFFRRRFLQTLGKYDIEFGLAEDQHFMLRAAMAAEPVVIPEVVVRFDATGAGSRRRPWMHYLDMIRAREDLGFTSTGSRLIDRLATAGLAGIATLKSVSG